MAAKEAACAAMVLREWLRQEQHPKCMFIDRGPA